MTMKVNFRLPDKGTVSYLTQIASVSYSKDKTAILRETVLDPMGQLQCIDLSSVLDNENSKV